MGARCGERDAKILQRLRNCQNEAMPKRIVIVGGGHNALVCAAYLARTGADVTVLERRHILGGAAVTEEFHPGFRNSTASYTVSLLHPKVIADLDLTGHGLRILPREVNNYAPDGHGNGLVMDADAGRARASIGEFSARDAVALDAYSARLGRLVPIVRDLMLQTPPDLTGFHLGDLPGLFRLSRHYLRLDETDKRFLIRLVGSSAGELLDDTFESDLLKAVLGFDAIVGHYASPYSPGSAYVLLHHVVGEVAGRQGVWGHAVGGMGAISDAIAAEGARCGARFVTDAAVDEIEVAGGRVRGVRTAAGGRFDADVVVAGVNPVMLFRDLLDPAVVDPETREHFRQYRCQSGTFRMNVALSGLPRFHGDPDERALTGGIIMAPSLGYMERAFADARRTGMAESPIVEMLIPSLVDDSLAPPGQHVASLFCQHFEPGLGAAWDEWREEAAATILATVDSFAPGFSDLVVGRQVHSPLDLERKFGLVGGDIFHGRLSLDQLFSARPMLGMAQYRTAIDGLWMCGAGTHPGGGVSGIPGHNAAREIIRRAL